MKILPIYVLTLFLWTSCKNGKSTSDKASKTTPLDSSDKKLKKEKANTKAATLNIREYGQKILDDKIQPVDNTETFACLDSIDDANADTRKFFFQVYKVIAKKSDGALSEVVCSYTKSYLQTFPVEALSNFKSFDSSEKKLFAENLAFEFYASGTDYKADIDEYFAGIRNSNPEVKAENQTIERIKTDLVASVSKMND